MADDKKPQAGGTQGTSAGAVQSAAAVEEPKPPEKKRYKVKANCDRLVAGVGRGGFVRLTDQAAKDFAQFVEPAPDPKA
jgi:hypothetical protein